MPASMTIALVASSPNVIGSRIEMPASGPIPGRTPTSVPTTQPRNAYHSTDGWSATEKPTQSASSVVPILCFRRDAETELFRASLLETKNSLFERRFERLGEQRIGEQREHERVRRRVVNRLALDHDQQHEHQKRHGDEKANRL